MPDSGNNKIHRKTFKQNGLYFLKTSKTFAVKFYCSTEFTKFCPPRKLPLLKFRLLHQSCLNSRCLNSRLSYSKFSISLFSGSSE